MPVTIPAGVEVSIAEPNVVTVKGPKGTLTQTMRPEMIIKVEGNVIHVGRPSEDKLHKSLHGLTRSLINDMVVGVTDGFKKDLEMMKGNLDGLAAQVTGIESAFAGEDFFGAKAQAESLKAQVDTLKTDMDGAKAKIKC